MSRPALRPAFRFDPSAAWLPRLASLVCFVALCALATHWVLTFSAMKTIPVPNTARVAQTEAVDTGAIATLFGGSAQAGVRDVQLIGVVANVDGTGPSAAILSLDGGAPKAVRAGAALSPQIKVVEIRGRGIVIERNGARQEIALPIQNNALAGRGAGLPAAPPSGAAAPLSTPMPATAAPAPAVSQPTTIPQQSFTPQPQQQPYPQQIPAPSQPIPAPPGYTPQGVPADQMVPKD
ncbi:general secretion pathway protein [Cupriavidus plantarum]|nr:general secretion pathway protein [Cupriavidus plantarum]